MRAFVLLLAACLLLAVPSAASALSPPPTVRNFDDLAAGTDISAAYAGTDIGLQNLGDGTSCFPTGTVFEETFGSNPTSNALVMDCNPGMRADFASPQAYVALRAFPTDGSIGRLRVVALTLEGFDALDNLVASTSFDVNTEELSSIAVAVPGGAARIDHVVLTSGTFFLDVDDIAYSAVPQPDTEITTTPPAATQAGDARFEFTANGPVPGFLCQLDGNRPLPCGSPADFSELVEGMHTFTVAAVDAYGTEDPTPATFTWKVDSTPPDTRIDTRPPALSTSDAATIAFSSPDADATSFECALDNAAFTSCNSPVTLNGLADGAHRFRVLATDDAGNRDRTAATANWTVDTTAPQTTIDDGPAPFIRTDTATVDFSSPATDAVGFECSLDSQAFVECASPVTYGALAEGQHRVRVRALDRAGNTDPTPASVTFTVDLTPPDTQIDSAPAALSREESPTIAFSSPDADAGAFECALDGAAFAACSSPLTLGPLAEGEHTFRVRAVDRAGNRDSPPAAVTWTVDLTPPNTNLNGGPTGITTATSATFTFGSGAPDLAGFQCALDGATFTGCVSPKTYDGLADRSHTLQVRAVDAAGNHDLSPAERTWEVNAQPPDTRIDSAPPAQTSDTSASVAFSSLDGDVTGFQCSTDGAAFAACSSPAVLTGLALGPHTVAVRAVDRADLPDPSPAAATWVVVPALPDRDKDGVPDTTDNCRDTANVNQADRDDDGIGDTCDELPPGDLPVVAGVRAEVRAVSGQVYVRLPGANLNAADLGAEVAQGGVIQQGFVPLEGIATIPLGSLIDTRKGVVSVATAADFRKGTDTLHREQRSRIQAGMFAAEQARKRRKKAPKKPFTDLALVSAKGAQAVCATKRRTSPTKGIVRELITQTKGRVRIKGGASTATVTKGASISTVDRCTGTVTKVMRGKVRVRDKRTNRTVTVTAGHSFLVKARLFAARKGRTR